MKNIVNYINESINKIQGLNGYTIDEVIKIIENYCDEQISSTDADVDEITEIWLHGSRMRGNAKSNSDLDAVLFYKGSNREDDLFNLLHDEDYPLEIDDISVDINPIKIEDGDDIIEYKKSSKKYDKEILGK